MYWGMIGSLLYLTTSRPNIVFSVGLCAKFQENPKKSHLIAVKRILRYLKGTTDLCLWYPKDSNFNLVGYADADYTRFLMDRKSTSSSDVVSEIAKSLENRFVFVGSIVETEKISGKNKKEKENESEDIDSYVREREEE
ncbi:secreted RxLR effector protein 161-like [Nicotiana sylvestris]|uniref:secreted RxLR effector protein 161-like n=1 Tax=Nicotiana sylvestris TaxID=4096 RepID=UPI00388CACCD